MLIVVNNLVHYLNAPIFQILEPSHVMVNEFLPISTRLSYTDFDISMFYLLR